MTELSKRIEEEFQFDALPAPSDHQTPQQASLDFGFEDSFNSFGKSDVFEQIGADPSEPQMKRQQEGREAGRGGGVGVALGTSGDRVGERLNA